VTGDWPERRRSSRASSWATFAAGLLICAIVEAIEAPKQQAPPAEAAPAQRAALEPTDQREFYRVLQHSAHARTLRGLTIPPETIAALARGEADAAVASLSALAAQGDKEANIALVRIQHWCNRVASARQSASQDQIAKLISALPDERAEKVAGVIQAENAYQKVARDACFKARFDFGAIEARLREAAQQGHAASATELAQFVRDPQQREALLQAAIKQRYAPAMYTAATNLVMAVQRGQTTENVSQIRLWLKQAGPTMPKAKLDLANCMSLGCDGHPADALSARAFGLDAARDGEPTAFPSIMRMPWGGRLTRVQHLAWQYFGDRLNEAGCTGEAYLTSAATFAQNIAMLEKGQPPQVLEEARREADVLWRDNGVRAMKEQGCAQTAQEAASR
jgi:hypothetical protein